MLHGGALKLGRNNAKRDRCSGAHRLGAPRVSALGNLQLLIQCRLDMLGLRRTFSDARRLRDEPAARSDDGEPATPNLAAFRQATPRASVVRI